MMKTKKGLVHDTTLKGLGNSLFIFYFGTQKWIACKEISFCDLRLIQGKHGTFREKKPL